MVAAALVLGLGAAGIFFFRGDWLRHPGSASDEPAAGASSSSTGAVRPEAVSPAPRRPEPPRAESRLPDVNGMASLAPHEQALLDLTAAWQASVLPAPPSGWLEAYARTIAMPCARLQLEGASSALRLHVTAATLEQARTLHRLGGTLPGVVGLETDMLPADAPVCPLLDFLNRRTLPSPTQLSALDRPVDGGGCAGSSCYAGLPQRRLHAGERLVMAVTSPPVASFLTVDLIGPDGTVVHLLPQAQPASGTVAGAAFAADVPPGETVWIGDGRAGPVTEEVTVGPPFGRAYVLVLASPTPLFDSERPMTEPLAVYLAALEQAVRNQPGPARPLASLLALDMAAHAVEGGAADPSLVEDSGSAREPAAGPP